MEKTETVAKTTEIRHIKDFDLVFSNMSSDQKLLNEILFIVTKNIEETGTPLDGWRGTANGRRFVDNDENPRFFAKLKWMSVSPDKLYWLRESTNFSKRENRNFAGIMNEFSLAPKVKEIMDSDWAKLIASKYRLEGVHFVEPLLGIISRRDGAKYIIYRYVNGRQFDPYSPKGKDLRDDRYKEIIEDVRTLMTRNGIYPADLAARQFIITDTDNIKEMYLTDIEAYEKI